MVQYVRLKDTGLGRQDVIVCGLPGRYGGERCDTVCEIKGHWIGEEGRHCMYVACRVDMEVKGVVCQIRGPVSSHLMLLWALLCLLCIGYHQQRLCS